MEKYLLNVDPEICRLDSQMQWHSLAQKAFQNWQYNQNDVNRLLVCGTQLWHMLEVDFVVSYDPNWNQPCEKICQKQVIHQLREVTSYGLAHFANDPAMNAYFGYLIYVKPEYFADAQKGYEEWKETGRSMLQKSYIIDPDSPFTKAMFYKVDCDTADSPFYDACREIWQRITPQQWGKTNFHFYLFNILFGDHFYPDAYQADENN